MKVISPDNRVKYIRHKYNVEIRQSEYIWITYDVDSSLVVPISLTRLKDSLTVVDSLRNCPQPPLDTLCCIDLIDTFRLRGDTLEISLSDEDSVHYVILDIPDSGGGGDADCCCNDCSFAIYREYFANVEGDSIIVTANLGRLPSDAAKLWVLREGNKQIEGLDTLGDYTYQDSIIRFGYLLDGEDLEVWFMVDTMTNNPVNVDREYFLNSFGTRVTPTEPLAANPFWLRVFVEGEEQSYGYDYLINGAHVDFTYYLDNEDVEVWAISDVDCDLRIFREWFPVHDGNTVSISGNQGNFPALSQAVMIWAEGWKQQDGPTGDYVLSGGTATFTYGLDAEDVEVWFIIGGVDTGILGGFQTD